MAPIALPREEHKTRLITEIHKYQSIQDKETVPLEPLQTLFTNLLTYLQDEGEECEREEDEFGEVDDSDLMLVDSGDHIIDSPGSKRKLSPDFEDIPYAKKPRLDENPAAISLARGILQKTWGFSEFRHQQEEAIGLLVAGGSAVVVFPTGGGKSLVYQIPALAFDKYDEQCGRYPGRGVTLVVSPLIALMKVGFQNILRPLSKLILPVRTRWTR